MTEPQRIPVQRRRTIDAEVIMRPKDPTRLFAERNARDWSQRDMAERVECSQTMIHLLETGKSGAKKPLASRISKEFGLKLEELFEVPAALLAHSVSEAPGNFDKVAS